MDDNERNYNQTKGLFESIREINRKYRTSRIKMTPMVTFSLWALRIYLLAMLVILFYKFIS
jgi:hypothetical protein